MCPGLTLTTTILSKGLLLGLAGVLAGCEHTPVITAAGAPAQMAASHASLEPPSTASPPDAAPPIPAPLEISASPEIPALPEVTAPSERERLLVASFAELGLILAELDEIDERIEQGDGEPLPRGARKRRRELLAAIDQLRVEVKAQVIGAPSYLNNEKLAPRAFAAIVAGLAANAQGRFQPLIHPELGLFVIHNMSGSIPHLDRVRTWKQDEQGQPYPLIDQEDVLSALAGAVGWRLGRKPHEDESGCLQLPDDIQARARNVTAFDSWAGVLGWTGWTPLPDRYRLAPLSPEAHHDASMHAAMQRAALAISHTAIIEGAHFDFGRIDDRWYLLAIDIYDVACG